MLGLFQPRCSKLFTVCPEFLVDLMEEFADQCDNARWDRVLAVGKAIDEPGEGPYT